MRILKRILQVVGVIVLLLGLAAGAVLYFMSWNDLRGFIAGWASESLGRKLSINGDLHVKLSLHPMVTADDVIIANAAWGSRPEMIKIKRMQLQLDLIPFLSGQTKIDYLKLVGLDALIEKNAQGQTNWQFAPAPRFAPKKEPIPEKREKFPVLAHLIVEESLLRYRDAAEKTDMTLGIRQMDGHGGGGSVPATLDGVGSYQHREFAVKAKFGSIDLLREKDKPYPVNFDVRMGDTLLQVQGDVMEPVKLQGVRVKLLLEGPDMKELWTLLGWPLAPTPRYRLAGELDKQGNTWLLKGFVASVGHSQLTGMLSVEIRAKAPPFVKGDLSSSLLDVSDVKGFIGEKKKGKPSKYVFSDEPFNLDKLRSVDGDVRFRTDRISARNVLLDDVALRLRMEGGKLELDPLDLGFASGKITSNLTLDARKRETAAAGRISIKRLNFHRMLSELGVTSKASGRMGGEAQIRTHGNSLHRMAQHADGQLTLVMEGGLLDRLLLELIALHLGDLTDAWLRKGQQLEVNCIVARFDIDDGRMDAKTFLLDTHDSNILGQGTIDLAKERLDMTLTAHSKDFKLGVTAPIHIAGDLKLRNASKSATGAIARAGVAVALGAAVNPLAALIPLLDIPTAQPNACQKAFAGAETTSGKLKGASPKKAKESKRARQKAK